MKKILIEFDGPDFSGKTSLLEALKKEPMFKSWGSGRLPGTSVLGETLRAFLKNETLEANTSLGVALAANSSAYTELASYNKNILADRGLTSVLMYQFILDKSLIKEPTLSEAVFSSLRNQVDKSFDYYRVVLLPDVETVLERKKVRGVEDVDRFDSLDESGVENMIETYRSFCEDSKHFDIHNTLVLYINKHTTIEDEVKRVLEFIEVIERVRNG